MIIEEYISKITLFPQENIKRVIELLNSGATIPFLARYRKEQTGNLNEEQLDKIQILKFDFETIQKRKQFIIESILKLDKLSDDLKYKIDNCFDSTKLEDIYLPYKQKKTSKSEKAIKAGLAPLAAKIMKQENGDIISWSERYIQKDFPDSKSVLSGAGDIINEWISQNEIVRENVRTTFLNHAVIEVQVVDKEKENASNFQDYFDYRQTIQRCPSYRLLAILRGVKEGVLKIKVEPDVERILNWLERFFVKSNSNATDFLRMQIKTAYKKYLYPSFENETLVHYKKIADESSVKTFSKNLEKLLLAPPVGSKRVMGIDPGFKSGCKVVVLDELGNLKTNVTIFPHAPQNDYTKASAKISQLVEMYKVEVIAIGDGTAGRETENFIKKIRFNSDLKVYVVREDGASIYSASKIAREEFPEFDVTVRGAVSIARRLLDPLAELVKIDPKSLGVGQYQHDVDQKLLNQKLTNTVVHAVNKVGVDVNTASKYLLSYVSGLGPKLAENIVLHRQKNGLFESRKDLLNVERMGDKAYEQAAGFLRIKNAKNLLDNSSVHPESYQIVNTILKSEKIELKDIIGNKEILNTIKSKKDLAESIGAYTFQDILSELEKPGLDPRNQIKIVEFDKSIKTIEDLKIGHELMGIVTNVTDFGAFVNIGIKENGLIHRSKLSLNQSQLLTDVIYLDMPVHVRIITIDIERKRIGLEPVALKK